MSDEVILPSILYTEGSADVKAKVEEELKVLDPDEKAAAAAIEENVKEVK